MKTIFITIFQGLEAKNILRTDVAKIFLKEPDVRLVCFVKSRDRAEYYSKEISQERIIYEVFYRTPKGALESFFSFLKFHLIRTKSTALKKRMNLEESGNWPLWLASILFNWIIARRFFRRLFRFFDYYFIGDPGFSCFFDKYRPDAVFLVHLFDDVETAFLREAKKRGVATIGYVNSWDKVTSRSSIRLLPDKLLVFNEIVKEEVIRHADMPEERIIVTGIPQYDQYVNEAPSPREEFFAKIGVDPSKKLVLYAPMGKAFSDSDWDMIDFLHSAVSDGRIGPNAELFVRFQPNDFIDESKLAKRPWLKYDLPGIRFSQKRGVDWDMGFDELKHLTDTLAHLSVLVCYASSIPIDAAIFDQPSVGINFEMGAKKLLRKSPTQYYHTEHYSKALKSGGIYLTRSEEELISAINRYLAHPELERQDRRRLVETQCWKLDGKSGERIAAVVINAMEHRF